MSDKPSETTKLPVWRTAKAAYLVIFYNPLLAVKLGIIPLVFVISPAILQGYLWGGDDHSGIYRRQDRQCWIDDPHEWRYLDYISRDNTHDHSLASNGHPGTCTLRLPHSVLYSAK